MKRDKIKSVVLPKCDCKKRANVIIKELEAMKFGLLKNISISWVCPAHGYKKL